MRGFRSARKPAADFLAIRRPQIQRSTDGTLPESCPNRPRACLGKLPAVGQEGTPGTGRFALKGSRELLSLHVPPKAEGRNPSCPESCTSTYVYVHTHIYIYIYINIYIRIDIDTNMFVCVCCVFMLDLRSKHWAQCKPKRFLGARPHFLRAAALGRLRSLGVPLVNLCRVCVCVCFLSFVVCWLLLCLFFLVFPLFFLGGGGQWCSCWCPFNPKQGTIKDRPK